MIDEIFGPVLTVYVYDDDKFDEVLTFVMNHLHTRLQGQSLLMMNLMSESIQCA